MKIFSKKVRLPIADSKKIATFATVLSKNSLGQDSSAVMFNYLFKRKFTWLLQMSKKYIPLQSQKDIYLALASLFIVNRY